MHIDEPLVSAVITTYNREKEVSLAIDSVINQTYRNIEILVVDDGSTDNTRDVVEKFKEGVKYYYKNNGGVASSKNYGINQAKGDYIAFLDSDDLWYPEKIAKQIQKLKANKECQIAISEIEILDKQHNHISFSNLRKTIIKDGDVLGYVIQEPSIGGGSTLLVDKKVFSEIGLFDGEFYTGQDQDWIFRACSKFKVVLVDEPLAKIIVTPGSNSKKLCTGNSLRALDKLQVYAPDFVKNNPQLILRIKAKINLRYAEDLLWNRYIVEARKSILKSIGLRLTPRALILYIKSILMQIFSVFLPGFKDKGALNANK